MAYLINDEHKLHINLSQHAWSVLDTDRYSFQIDNLSGQINRIFCCYYESALASISIACNDKREYYSRIITTSNKDKIIDSLIKDYEFNIYKAASSYPKGETHKIRINNANVEYLTEECNENLIKDEEGNIIKYGYPTMSAYVKAVIEEYCSKTFLEREEIYYKQYFDTINNAFRDGTCLKLQITDGSYRHMKPYTIRTDIMATYHYLVGYDVNDETGEKRSISYRIANLKNIRQLREKSFISEADKKFLDKQIEEKGAQFMYADVDEFIIRLTDAGIAMYNRILHLRPPYSEIHGNEYHFKCTLTQIEFYFFKFGADAKIIESKNLRDKFKDMYKTAYELYEE